MNSSNRIRFLQEEIKLTKQRIKYLNYVIKDRRESTEKSSKEAEKLKIENTKRTHRLPQFASKVNKIDQYARQHASSLEQQKLKVNQKLKSLIMKRREHVNDLIKFIFPIELVEVEILSSRRSSEVTEEGFDSILAEMEDAMTTSYIHGRWVSTSMSDG